MMTMAIRVTEATVVTIEVAEELFAPTSGLRGAVVLLEVETREEARVPLMLLRLRRLRRPDRLPHLLPAWRVAPAQLATKIPTKIRVRAGQGFSVGGRDVQVRPVRLRCRAPRPFCRSLQRRERI